MTAAPTRSPNTRRGSGPAVCPADTIRVSGSPADRVLLTMLQDAFRRQHPEIAFTQSLYGPESTLAGIYTGTADLALMARELREPLERMAFEWVLLGRPMPIAVALAGISTDRPNGQLGVFVHRENPLQQLSLRQLDGIYGAEFLRGGAAVRTWDHLGLGGAWAGRPIRIYGPPVDDVSAVFLRRAVLADSRKWNPDYRQLPAAPGRTLGALARDRLGIAYAPLTEATGEVRALALGENDDGPFHRATARTLRSGAYPLIRTVVMVTAQTSGQPMRPALETFLRLVLGDAGQAIIAAEGGYLPLGRIDADTQRRRLG